MEQDDQSLHKIVETIHDLSELLRLSHDAALRLKRDIPGECFPIAYKLAKTIQVLQEAVDELQHNVDDPVLKPRFRIRKADLISSSDRL